MVGQEEMFFASDPVYQKTVLLAMMNSLCCSFLMLVAVVGSKSLVFSPCLLVVPCRYTTFGMLSNRFYDGRLLKSTSKGKYDGLCSFVEFNDTHCEGVHRKY
jgi:hypothetical protein